MLCILSELLVPAEGTVVKYTETVLQPEAVLLKHSLKNEGAQGCFICLHLFLQAWGLGFI